MIRVLIADDHVIVRNGLKQMFEVMGNITVVGEATNGDEVMKAIRRGGIDLVVLDLSMPGASGTDLIGRIRARDQALPILVLSMHNDPQIAKRVLEAGAAGFVTKGSGLDILMLAVGKVAAGERFADSAIIEHMILQKRTSSPFSSTPASTPYDCLTERERQIMRLCAQGVSLKSIAEQLFISTKTVSTHKVRVMRKMNFKTNAELVRHAVDHGLIE